MAGTTWDGTTWDGGATTWDSNTTFWDGTTWDSNTTFWDCASPTVDLINGGIPFQPVKRPNVATDRERRGITRRQEQAAEAIKEAAALQWQVDALDRAIAAFDAAETHNESDQIATLLQNIYDANSEQAQRWLATVREQWLFRQNQNAIAVLLLI